MTEKEISDVIDWLTEVATPGSKWNLFYSDSEVEKVARDALEIVMDMPKVMTLQDVFSSKHTIVCEFRWGVEPQHFQLKDIVRWLKQGRKYGESWRCWTLMPTQEQRKATLWN